MILSNNQSRDLRIPSSCVIKLQVQRAHPLWQKNAVSSETDFSYSRQEFALRECFQIDSQSLFYFKSFFHTFPLQTWTLKKKSITQGKKKRERAKRKRKRERKGQVSIDGKSEDVRGELLASVTREKIDKPEAESKEKREEYQLEAFSLLHSRLSKLSTRKNLLYHIYIY